MHVPWLSGLTALRISTFQTLTGSSESVPYRASTPIATEWVSDCFIAVTILKETQSFITKNVIVAFAGIFALDDREILTWALPGGEETTDYDEAYEWAERTNHIIRFNLAKYSRSILNLN